MALSEYEENILAELENEFKDKGNFFAEELKDIDEDKMSSSNKDDTVFSKSIKSFDPRKAVFGFFGFIFGLCLILFAVYSYSAFGVWASVLSAIFAFILMVFSISKFIQSFSLNV